MRAAAISIVNRGPMDDKARELDGTIIDENQAGEQERSSTSDGPQSSGGKPPGGGETAGLEAPIILRPTVRSMWFLFFGLLLGPVIMYLGRDPDGHPAKWVALSLLSLGLILHRLGLRYVIADGKIRARPWWGLGTEEAVTLAAITEVRPTQGFVGRLVGSSHLDVRSGAFDEPGFIIMGQPDGWHLARKLEQLAAEARRSAAARSAAPARPGEDQPVPPEADRGPG